ncbi:MAG: 6,7-dimethyl-8-ribityllumazine synthase [Chloroflexi bacterium]|nr:6,7-dimethyl-8-ribityllumazine synthase [Chloroflexota bacterium]
MSRNYEGALDGKGLRIALVVSRFNSFVTGRLLDGARDALLRHGVSPEDIDVARVPGCMEIPLAAKKLAESRRYAAVVALGAVIRGETPHFEYVASEASSGITSASLETGVPILYGIITADNSEQAIERAGIKSGNKGYDAAVGALEMANLLKAIGEE